MQIYLRFSALGDKKKWRKKLQDLTSLCTFAPMKLQINYHTTYSVIKRITLLMLFFLCTLSCYSNDNLPQLEVKQRKGNMLIKLHNNDDTTSRLEKGFIGDILDVIMSKCQNVIFFFRFCQNAHYNIKYIYFII